MNFKVMTKFKYNKKEYYIVSINDSELVYVIKNNQKITTNLEQEDLKILKTVHNSLKINTQNAVDLGVKNINNKRINIFYDTQNKLYFWYKICDRKIIKTNYKENIILNNRYNNIPNEFYLKDVFKKASENKYIKRFIKIGHKEIALLIAATISFTIFNNNVVMSKQDKDNGIIYTMPIKESIKLYRYDYAKIEKAILENPYLKEEEKDLLKKLKFVFDENYQYMNVEEIIERLKKLKIEYYSSEDEYVNGSYDCNKDVIKIYGASNFQEARFQTLVHEILHVFQASTLTQGRFIMELSNQLLTQEVLRRMVEKNLIENGKTFENEYEKYTQFDKSGYNYFMYIEYYLAEILTQEQLKDYQFFPDEETVVNALLQIDGVSTEQMQKAIKEKEEKQGKIPKETYKIIKKRDKVYKLLDTIDSIFIYNEEENRYIIDCFNEKYLEKYCEIYSQLDYYYTKKYGKSMANNFLIGLQDKDVYHDIKIADNNLSTLFFFLDTGALDEELISKKATPEIYKIKRENAVKKTLLKYAYINENQEDNIQNIYEKEDSVKQIYYLPRSYFCNEAKYAKIYFISEKCTNSMVEVNDEVQKTFQEFYQEGIIKKEEWDER